ncbi:MAG: hypothetical protein DBX55_00060 [Verrucomicrobia bacterium]|nr:MAG: hypothetical protein DBX55_00060 [Verrucomicrobiota bacterium]
MKKIIIGLLVAGAAVAANAQDKALLETLVKKGMLTQQEAAQIAKDSVSVSPAAKSTKSIKIFGGGQGWYSWGQSSIREPGSVSSPRQTSGFTLQYVKLGVEADVGAGWSGTIVTDFGDGIKGTNYLDKVIASKKFDLDYLNGRLDLGLRKVNMGYEQNMCDFGQLAIDRSVATYFFTRADGNDSVAKNFGSRTVGVFWEGNVLQVAGLYYSAAVTSSVSEGSDDVLKASNSLSFWASLGYKKVAEVNGESISYDAGINFGYAPQGSSLAYDEAIGTGSIWGINPYASINWRGLTFIGEFFFQQVEDYNAASAGTCRSPFGANATVAYKMDLGEWGALEPVARFSFVASNGLGVSAAGQLSSGSSLGYDSELRNGLSFDNALTMFVGVNWYPTAAVKTSIGYEYGYYYDRATQGSATGAGDVYRAYNNTVRAQVQVLF